MQTVTKIIYGEKYLPDLVNLAITVGIGAGSAVLIGGLYYGFNNHNRIIHNRIINWANVSTWGSIGTIIASQYVLLKGH